jgi:hypothetical protein
MSRNPNRFAFSIALALLGAAPASGAAGPPPELARTVQAFAGRWTLDATQVLPGGESEKAKVHVDCKQAAMGKGAACDMRGTFPRTGAWEGHFLIGFDTFGGKVHVMAVTSDESVHDHTCAWQGPALVCDRLVGGSGGQPVTEDLRFVFDAGTMTIKVVAKMKEGGQVFFDATGKRH